MLRSSRTPLALSRLGGFGFLLLHTFTPARSWTSSGPNNQALVHNLRRDGSKFALARPLFVCANSSNLMPTTKAEIDAKPSRFQSDRVGEAMLTIDRRFFCPTNPYSDSPQYIGYGATISAPHMHAHALQALSNNLFPGANVLDVGCGSGYLLGAFAHMVGPEGRVWGVEHIPELADLSRHNIERGLNQELRKRINITVSDGREGLPDAAPFDAIHVGAAAPDIPKALTAQLKPGGRMIIPVGVEFQDLLQVDKSADGTIHAQSLMGVRFIPLTAKERQLREDDRPPRHPEDL